MEAELLHFDKKNQLRSMAKKALFLYRKRIQFVAVKVECFCKRFRHESSQQKVKFLRK